MLFPLRGLPCFLLLSVFPFFPGILGFGGDKKSLFLGGFLVFQKETRKGRKGRTGRGTKLKKKGLPYKTKETRKSKKARKIRARFATLQNLVGIFQHCRSCPENFSRVETLDSHSLLEFSDGSGQRDFLFICPQHLK